MQEAMRRTDSARDALPVQGDRDEARRLALQVTRRQIDGAGHGRGPGEDRG